MSSAGKRLLSAIVTGQDLEKLIGLGLKKELFNEVELPLYSLVMGHLQSFGAIPHQDTIIEKLGDTLVDAPEPPEYYLHELEQRHMHTTLKRMINLAAEHLKDSDPDKAFDLMANQISEIGLFKKRHSIIDFRDIAPEIYSDYLAQKKDDDKKPGLFFGWESMDSTTGGLMAGDFCSIVGRPASGKTFMELFIANNDWEKGGSPFFLSMEMMLKILGKRLAAMSAHKPLTHLLKGMLTSKAFNHMVKTLELNKEKNRPFWLCDGNMASTVDDVVMLCRQLKPTSCFIDGAYLLRHPNPRISRFDRITENAEMIKQRIATDLGIPCVCSYQFSREVAKKAKNKKTAQEKAGLEDIYGSDAIGQLSTIALGLFEEESVETQVRRKVDVMKGRNGETGDFLIHWDFLGMDFSEVSQDTSELQFTG